MYEFIFRYLLTRFDAERVHRLSFVLLRLLVRIPGVARAMRRRLGPSQPVDAMGLRFPGPVGLAAGFDKNAEGIDGLAALGFAYVEVGTVTARAQPGNPRPRLFRLVRDRAIVNRMGFNNDGAEVVARRLARWRRRSPLRRDVLVGVNIGKSKVTPPEDAVTDYKTSARLVAPYADYLVVNVSSPNTPGLRDLQAVDELRPLLVAVRGAADEVTTKRVPLLVKIAPDLSDDDVIGVAKLANELDLDGVIATNTTISRAGLASSPLEIERVGEGGLSGAPLKQRSLTVLRLLGEHVDDSIALVSVGGVSSADDVAERLAAGATLVQAYTGLIYGGPLWPSRTQVP